MGGGPPFLSSITELCISVVVLDEKEKFNMIYMNEDQSCGMLISKVT